MAPLVELVEIVKTWPGVRANDGVSLAIEAGEVHGLLGENGAGKTTLMSILSGLYQPDSGSIRMGGEEVSVSSPRDALGHGIAIVQQHFALVPTLTVAENVVLGAEPGRLLSRRALRARVAALADRYHLDLDPAARVSGLSVGGRQRVEVLKCLYRDPRVLILDEPTAVLTPVEVERLFEIVRGLVEGDRAVVLITHKLDELMAVSDRITVLRAGRTVATVQTADVDPPTLARLMVGREVRVRSVAAFVGLDEDLEPPDGDGDVGDGAGAESATAEVAVPALRVVDLCVHDRDGVERLDGLSLEVGRGEILGLAGVEGNGQRELVEVLSGTRRPDSGRVELAGADVTRSGPLELAQAGMGVITEDRHATGVVLEMTVAENLVSDRIGSRPWSRLGVINRRAVEATAADLVARFGIRVGGTDARMRSLSGGNQQRAVLARALSRDPTVLVAAQPTRGLDVGAIEDVTARITAVRDAGGAVLLISSDLAEVLALSDRVAVIHRGRVLTTLPRERADPDVLGPLLAGIAPGDGP